MSKNEYFDHLLSDVDYRKVSMCAAAGVDISVDISVMTEGTRNRVPIEEVCTVLNDIKSKEDLV